MEVKNILAKKKSLLNLFVWILRMQFCQARPGFPMQSETFPINSEMMILVSSKLSSEQSECSFGNVAPVF